MKTTLATLFIGAILLGCSSPESMSPSGGDPKKAGAVTLKKGSDNKTAQQPGAVD